MIPKNGIGKELASVIAFNLKKKTLPGLKMSGSLVTSV